MNARQIKGMTAAGINKTKKEEVVKEEVIKEEVIVQPEPQPTPEPKKEELNPMDRLKAFHQQKEEEEKEKFKQVTVYLNKENLALFKKHFKKKGQKSELINELLDTYFEMMGLKEEEA